MPQPAKAPITPADLDAMDAEEREAIRGDVASTPSNGARLTAGGLPVIGKAEFIGMDAPSKVAPPPEQPTAKDPLRGLEHLSRVAVVGRDAIVELAERPIVWLWDYITTSGLIVLLAAGPGSGKTTLLFLLLAARANRGMPVAVLGRTVATAPEGKFLVVIENEHSDESAARILCKSLRLLSIDDVALERVILVARGNVRIGDPAWVNVETLIAAGLVSDIALDTLARCAPSDANDEREQVEVFSRIADAIQKAPTPEARPTCWTAAHTRKCEGMPTLADVGGSTQRAGQADVVLLMGAQRAADRLTSVKVAFGKVREKDAEDWPAPVEYVVKKTGVVLVDAPEVDERPLEARIVSVLEVGPATKNQLREKLGRSAADIEDALSTLFSARAITTVTVKVRGRDFKAFALRNDADSTRRATPDFTPDSP
jgi:hypothetical protein